MHQVAERDNSWKKYKEMARVVLPGGCLSVVVASLADVPARTLVPARENNQ